MICNREFPSQPTNPKSHTVPLEARCQGRRLPRHVSCLFRLRKARTDIRFTGEIHQMLTLKHMRKDVITLLLTG